MSESEFRQIRDIVFSTTGISLADSKKALVISRLARRLAELKFNNYIKYIQRLKSDTNEIFYMINRITTNLTRFYREDFQFPILKEQALPSLLSKAKRGGKKTLRVWSAGCSTGEEVYTVLFEILDFFKGSIPSSIDFKILGSDIDTNVLSKAKRARYSESEIKGLSPRILSTYFDRASQTDYIVKDAFRKYVTFSRNNLVYDEFNFKSKIDIIFCRNVVIYFNTETKQKVYEKFYAVLNEPGYFFSGHSENLFKYSRMFKFIGKSVYKKVV